VHLEQALVSLVGEHLWLNTSLQGGDVVHGAQGSDRQVSFLRLQRRLWDVLIEEIPQPLDRLLGALPLGLDCVVRSDGFQPRLHNVLPLPLLGYI